MALLYPTLEEFRYYSGENLESKLVGDIKDPNKLLNNLFKRCEMHIRNELVGIKISNLTEEQEQVWKDMLCEQAEYLLSVGDPSLMQKNDNWVLSENVYKMAKINGLYTQYETNHIRQPFIKRW